MKTVIQCIFFIVFTVATVWIVAQVIMIVNEHSKTWETILLEQLQRKREELQRRRFESNQPWGE